MFTETDKFKRVSRSELLYVLRNILFVIDRNITVIITISLRAHILCKPFGLYIMFFIQLDFNFQKVKRLLQLCLHSELYLEIK